MNRRKFVRGASAVATGALLADTRFGFGQARAADCTRLPGVQLYTIRDALQRDPRAALAALREIGIREAEMYNLNGPESAAPFGMPASDFKRLLDDNGLQVPLSHVGGALTNIPAIAEIAHTLGITTLAVALPSEFSQMRDGRFAMVGAESLAQMDRLAERLNEAGREYKANGLGFGYHNHHVEFLEVEQTVPYEHLMANTDPDLVKIELDLGWLAVAGVDPVEYLHKYAGRVIACHMKDYAPGIATDVPQRKLVEPGAGSIDFAAVLAAMDETGVAHGFVEIDVSDDPLGAVRRGHEYLEELRACG
jgi:sugar phosphate isomerase/epimerase